MVSSAVALWCALALVARATAYTVDCNHEYTDCDTELSKLTDDDELLAKRMLSMNEAAKKIPSTSSSPTVPPTRPIPTTEAATERTTEVLDKTTTDTEDNADAQRLEPRLLTLNVDELQTFANALHNQTRQKIVKKPITDLSDVTLDGDEDDDPKMGLETKPKHISDRFYSNLEAPFSPIMGIDRASSETELCKENEVSYKVGEKIDRGCEETCECAPNGVFECSPRCKHPYIRRGRRLIDPLCFESPVDECCSIVACATGNGDVKPTKVEICRYGNGTYQVGAQWHIGCEQTCTCEKNSVVTCRPRCERHQPSEKCINVQDPNDVCCEVQVCDVSQDVHEESENSTTTTNTTTTTTTTEAPKSSEEYSDERVKTTLRPLVLTEPIGSVRVLQNNTVQVNLIHMNNTEDPIHLLLSDDNGQTFKEIELNYSNLILNLRGGKDYILKTKETETKFNFTITATSEAGVNEVAEDEHYNETKSGCYHDGVFYAVGEEFHIGCTELCECTGPDQRECAALLCPAHVGLELVSKGCVRWAPMPPARPPNCCPRSARCLSDGTCHYKGTPVPNWSEVPIELTGCEQRCFCENGDLECQETCTPLPAVPPQTLRCPPMHRPAPVNISDDDCCKRWGCLPHAGSSDKTTRMPYVMPTLGATNYVTPIEPILPTVTTSKPTMTTTDLSEHYRHMTPLSSIATFLQPPAMTLNDIPKYSINNSYKQNQGDNISMLTLKNVDSPMKITYPDPTLTHGNSNWDQPALKKHPLIMEPLKIPLHNDNVIIPNHGNHYNTFMPSDAKIHDLFQQLTVHPSYDIKTLTSPNSRVNQVNENIQKLPTKQREQFNYYLPILEKQLSQLAIPYQHNEFRPTPAPTQQSVINFFEPVAKNHTYQPLSANTIQTTHSYDYEHRAREFGNYGTRNKQVTILRNKEKLMKPTDELWAEDTKTHLLTKTSNPYETVLLRPITNAMTELAPQYGRPTKVPKVAEKTYSSLDLEHILSQMEVESEVNRNLGRSADKNRDVDAAGQTTESDFTNNPAHTQPSFLPTIPPEIHFPQDDIPDYDQNNIHRPVNSLPSLPPGFPTGIHNPPGYGDNNKKLSVISLQADSPTSVMMLFGLPPVLVGLRGSVDLRYTDKADEDISHWFSQVFAPADEVLTTPRLEFRLTGLKPSTTYKLRGKLYLHNLPVEPESEIYTVRTQDITTGPPAEEKRREIDSRLTVVDVNDTSAHLSWRHFTQEELQFIDGIQVRYRPVGTPIYSMTELLHHSRSAAELHDLRAGSRYEASLVLVPPPKATTELHDPGVVEFTTSPYVDPYNWTVTIEARAVGSEAAELSWRGVPSPAERWVRVYRAAHACGTSAARKEHDAFRLATRDLPPAVTLTGLEPDARCRVWLELFLTNGKIKTSNVIEIHTKSLDSPEPIDNEIESASVSLAGSRGDSRGDYYGALVIVGVVAALGALTSMLLLLVVVRRHRPRSVPITPVPTAPRESSLPPYDNPAYKLELQQETMDL